MGNKQRIWCDIFFWKTVICHLWKPDEAFQNLVIFFKEVKKAIWSTVAFWIYKICRCLSRFRLMRWWWWWIVFVVWLTDERLLTLFPAGTIVRDPHQRKSPTPRELEPAQNLSSDFVEWSCAVVITTTPRRQHSNIFNIVYILGSCLNYFLFKSLSYLTHFKPMIYFYTPWKNQRFSDVFRGYRNEILAQNGLNIAPGFVIIILLIIIVPTMNVFFLNFTRLLYALFTGRVLSLILIRPFIRSKELI